jgi:hypothetical protein
MDVWNACMMDLVRCSKFHCFFYMARTFVNQVNALKAQAKAEAETKSQTDNFNNDKQQLENKKAAAAVLKKLCDLFILFHLGEDARYLLEDGFMQAAHTKCIDSLVLELARELRQDVVHLVDAFRLPDLALNSAIGKYDGNVYKNYFDAVKSSPHQQMATCGKPFYWEELIKPLLSQK